MAPGPTLQDLIDTVQSDTVGGDPLDQLAQASLTVADLESVGDALLGHFVEQCRGAGRSWSEISTALGVSKQAAHKRFTAPAPTFERFTPRARVALRAASEEAAARGDADVGTPHILIGLFEPAQGLAARVLDDAGITRQACVEHLWTTTATRPASPSSASESRPYGSAAKLALRRTLAEALQLGHNYIGTEHMLLALFGDPNDPAARALAALGATYDDTRARLVEKFAEITKPPPSD
jgi:Clp amino terminal domain, pathogenicity island component